MTLLLTLAFALFIYVETRLVRSLDEFQRQVQFLALAIAFPCSLAAALGVGFFAAEGLLARTDPRDLPFIMLLCYMVGYAIAWRRYR